MQLGLQHLETLEKHFLDFFEGHDYEQIRWENGPMKTISPAFKVLRFSPGPRLNHWVYVSVGASMLRNESGKIEFAIFSAYESPRFVELLTMSAHYHRSYLLGLGHTVALGEPWVDGSKSDHYLISLPYPLGEGFEICNCDGDHSHTFWLLPITKAERDFKVLNGQEALEAIFEERGLEYLDFQRASLV